MMKKPLLQHQLVRFTFMLVLFAPFSILAQTEVFNVSGETLPSGWTGINNIDDNVIERGDYFLLEAGDPGDQILTSSYDLSTYNSAVFTCKIATFGSGSANPALVEISYDGGATFSQTETSHTPSNSTYIFSGTIHLNSISPQVVFKISDAGTSGRGVRLQELTLTGYEQNQPPRIEDININPISPTSSDAVSVSANIFDVDGIASVILNWGTSSGNLGNQIVMNLISGETYQSETAIPPQMDGTTVFYAIVATDGNGSPETNTSQEQNYLVQDPVATNNIAIQDFDASTPQWQYSSDVAFFDNDFGSDGYFGIINSGNVSQFSNPNFNTNILAENDLNDEGENGTDDFASITFQPVDISTHFDVQLSFDYQIIGYNSNNDVAKYEVFYDGASQGEVFLVEGGNDPEDASGTITIAVPDNVDTVSLKISIQDNGETGFSGFDNFILQESDQNQPPVITDIAQTPNAENVHPSDAVSVFAAIIDHDGFSSVTLNWGTTSGMLTNSIPMSAPSGGTYTTDSAIPPQGDGTTVFYAIHATDNNTTPKTGVSAEQTYTVNGPAPSGNILITEIMKDPEAVIDDYGEYFEVYNKSDHDIDMNGWTYSDSGGDAVTVASSLIVPSHGFVVFGKKKDKTINGNVSVDYVPDNLNFFSLVNTSDEIILTDAEGNEIDRVEYDNGQNWPNSTGASMYFKGTVNQDNNDGSLWKESTTSLGIEGDSGSPGFSGESQLPETYRYTGFYAQTPEWLPENPSGISTDQDIIKIDTATATLMEDTKIYNLTIKENDTLMIDKVFSFLNYIHNDGKLVFKSNVNGTAQLDEVLSGASIFGSGNAIVQRFVPAGDEANDSNESKGRAFRFVSPAVTTSTPINVNWQEGGHNTGINFPSDNQNPKPGYGTHITGSTTGNNGFDATPSGNPSLFAFDNQSSQWSSVSNTDQLNLIAGKPYRLFVRGDRSVNVADNETLPTNTILEAKGELFIGAYTETNLNPSADAFNFIGNPYQASVNMKTVLEHSTSLNASQYYVYDPNVNTRGAYVTVDLSNGNNDNPMDSEANKFLQPGQAAFVRTSGSGGYPELSFLESDKAVDEAQTVVFSTEEQAFLNVQLMNGNNLTDAVRINFSENGDNAVSDKDAAKLGNLDENLAVVNGNDYLSLEYRALPLPEDVLPLYINQYRHADYTFKIKTLNLPENIQAYLDDAFLGTHMLLENNATNLLDFSIDQDIQGSSVSDRFSISFEESTLKVDKSGQKSFSIFPNPVEHGERIFVQIPELEENSVQINVYDMLGKLILGNTYKNPKKAIAIKTSKCQAGVYLIQVNTGKNTSTQKIIVQ